MPSKMDGFDPAKIAKEQRINKEISKYENLNNTYNQELENYKKSLNYANKLYKSLQDSCNSVNEAKDNLKMYFKINGKIPDQGKLSESISNLEKMKSTIVKQIIPGIENKIKEISRNIANNKIEINNLRRQI